MTTYPSREASGPSVDLRGPVVSPRESLVGVRMPPVCIKGSFIDLISLHYLATYQSEGASVGLNRPAAELKCSSVTHPA